ncbi:MAG TPA: DUF1553 domain-containing protein [Gemmataceae bacterium]|jgi:hypothetical protein|nr:DUF1553 domain-containing protein [Gemmataceae bacterium]
MSKYPFWIVCGGALLLSLNARPVQAAAPAPSKEAAAAASAAARDIEALAAKIDQHLAARQAEAKAQAAPLADDSEFVRRAYLDIVGRIPTVAEVRKFLANKAKDKRRQLIDELLKRPGYVSNFTNQWRSLFMAEADSSFVGRYLVPGFEDWLKRELARDAGYDQIVRKILTVPMDQQAQQAFGFFGGGNGELTPAGFYLSKEIKAENLAAATARMFLGIRLECAQCHDHPFATWKREHFWGMAAFFAGIQRQENGDFTFPAREINDRREIAIPGSDRVVQASYLDGSEPQWKFKIGSRVTLADWVTSPNNPYFARTTVNRMWAHFFGLGLVEPIDDMVGSETVAYHPELLNELAQQFAAHNFDLKFLIRVLTATQAYQRTSDALHASQADPHLFARMMVRGMTQEQLFDSLSMAIGYHQTAQQNPFFVFNDNSPRSKFLEKFARRNEKATEPQTSILQALALMNSQFVAEATTIARSETLAAVVDSPFMDTAARIETLYLATLSRKPRPEELARLVKYVEHGGREEVTFVAFADAIKNVVNNTPTQIRSASTKDNALADVLWAILNSSEFILNH